jgi:hypothetical protein
MPEMPPPMTTVLSTHPILRGTTGSRAPGRDQVS